jgi:hypothetical protein
MARGRLISRTLGSSRKFAALNQQAGKLAEFAQALYPMLVANADDFGRQAGDAFTVKLVVFPSSPRKETEFFAALTAMHHVGLIQCYETEKGQVIQVVDFKEHQPGLSKRTTSKFDEPPVKFTGTPGNSLLRELNRTEEKGTEQNRTALMRRDDDPFQAFWMAYPKKKSRSDAEKAWRKLAPSPELTQRILDAVAAQRNSPQWLKDNGQFIPYPASWLNAKRWEDEADQPPKSPIATGEWNCPHGTRCHTRYWCEVVMPEKEREALSR